MASSLVRRNAQDILNGPLARRTYLLPMYGAYVVFTLNPVATLEALEDPIATEQAAALTTKKYVGYISRVSDLALPERRYHRSTCHLLSNSLPAASEADHTEETMFIPIAPATHPEGRTALTPTPPLPWDGLYHHTLEEIDLRVTTDSSPSVDHSLSPMLPMRGILEMKRVVNADFWRQSQLQTAYEAAHPESSQKPTLFPCPLAEDDSDHDNDRDDRSSYYSDGSDSEDLSESSDASSDDLNWIPETLRDPFVVREDPAHRFMPVVDFNVDLSTVPEFTDAKYFFEEIAAIERIRAESEERSLDCIERLEVERLVDERQCDASASQRSPKSTSLILRLIGKTRAKVERPVGPSESEKYLERDREHKTERRLRRYYTIGRNGIVSFSRAVISVVRSCLPCGFGRHAQR